MSPLVLLIRCEHHQNVIQTIIIENITCSRLWLSFSVCAAGRFDLTYVVQETRHIMWRKNGKTSSSSIFLRVILLLVQCSRNNFASPPAVGDGVILSQVGVFGLFVLLAAPTLQTRRGESKDIQKKPSHYRHKCNTWYVESSSWYLQSALFRLCVDGRNHCRPFQCSCPQHRHAL